MARKHRKHISQRQPRDELGRFSPASKTSGPSFTRRASTTAGPSSTRRASTISGPSSTRRASTTAGRSSTRRASTTAGPSTNRRASTTTEPSSTRRNSSTKGPSSTRRTSTKTLAAMDTVKGAGASFSRAHEMQAGCNLVDGQMDVTRNGAETEVQISFDKMRLTIIYTDDSDNEAPLLSGKNIRAQAEELRRVIKRKLKYKMTRGEMIN